MNIRLAIAQRMLPHSVKREVFQSLFHTASSAFGMPEPNLRLLPEADWLPVFAALTRKGAETASMNTLPEIRSMLFAGARDIGEHLRNLLRIRGRNECFSALRLLYHHIGISLREAGEGAVVAESCFFSREYTSAVCAVMESMDQGLAFGLSGGGVLRFTERITEGCPCCRALLVFPEKP